MSERFVLNNPGNDHVITGYTSVKVSCAQPGAQVGIYGGTLLRRYDVTVRGCKIGIPAQPVGTRVIIRYDFWNGGNPAPAVQVLAPGPSNIGVCTGH